MKVITSHSNYVLRRKAQATSLGSIYERDWMTVSEMDGFAPGLLPVYQSGNFKISVNGEVNTRKRYSYSNWVKNGEDDFWTLGNTDAIEIKVDKTVLKPNYTSLLDFAYYGSAQELIHASFNDIVKKFPAEVYLGNDKFSYPRDGEFITLKYYGDDFTLNESGTTLFEIDNPFQIDFGTVYIEKSDSINPNRFMCLSSDRYEVIFHEGEVDERRFGLCWDVDNRNVRCTGIDPQKYIVVDNIDDVTDPDETKYYLVPNEVQSSENWLAYNKWAFIDGEKYDMSMYYLYDYTVMFTADLGFTTVYGLSINGETRLFHDGSCTGFHIRLKEDYINEAFESLDDFERAVLSRETVPNYKMVLETPKETDRGTFITMEEYVCPVKNGWNIDIEGATYQVYVERLLKIAEYYDTYRSDNILRSYTHESITNFDWTTMYETEGPEIDNVPIDTERIKNILRVYGRQFDDLKRYLENIKFSYNLSYSAENNVPDNILSRLLEYNGWDVKNVSPLESNTITVRNCYPGKILRSTSEDGNIEFMRRLSLNSRNILSKKGTRAAIKTIFSLFGIPEVGSSIHTYSTDETERAKVNATGYSIAEYDVFATKFPSGNEIDKIEQINEKKDTFYSEYQESQNNLSGLLVSSVGVEQGENVVEYLVPWHDKTMKYNSNPYFQMYGGWGKRASKKVQIPFAEDITEIGGNAFSFGLYDETAKNVRIVNHTYNLTSVSADIAERGIVYYCLDLQYFINANENVDSDELTHYFVLREVGVCDRPVVKYSDEYEWVPVYYSDFEDLETETFGYNAARVLYCESVNDTILGNNPHNGKSLYDDGEGYFEFYQKIFKSSEDDENYFARYKAELGEQNASISYKNRFVNPESPMPFIEDITSNALDYGFGVFVAGKLNLKEDNRKVWFYLRDDSLENWVGTLSKREGKDGEWGNVNPAEDFAFSIQSPENEFVPVKIDGGTSNTELSSYSVLNSKKLVITYSLSKYYKDYITNVVESYIKQVVPSTTILEFVWKETESESDCRSEIFGMVGNDPFVFGVLSDEDMSVASSALGLSPGRKNVKAKAEKTKFSVTSKNVNKSTIGTVE